MAKIQRIIVTGGAGFIGSNFIRLVLSSTEDIQVLNVDTLTYAGNLENLNDVENHSRYQFRRCDVANRDEVDSAFLACQGLFGGPVDAVVHFAAESHVDRSIEDPSAFLRTNVIGTQVMLEAAKRFRIQKFVHVSTDEVYGSLGPEGAFTEDMPLLPNSPYSASKAGSDLIVRAYHRTYGFPAIITRCSNNYGPYQFPEKLIPLMISNALDDQVLPVYGDGLNVRDWIHVEDHCKAVYAALMHGQPGHVYNIGGYAERTNLDVVRTILKVLRKPEGLIRFVPDRPGHDRRYAIDSTKIRQELGWEPTWNFEDGISATIGWYLANTPWVQRVRSGSYRDYYDRVYGDRLGWLRSV